MKNTFNWEEWEEETKKFIKFQDLNLANIKETKHISLPIKKVSQETAVTNIVEKTTKSHVEFVKLTKSQKNKIHGAKVLDLHGFHYQEAHDMTIGFILHSKSRGEKVVIIITGKGLHSKDKEGVLKRSLESWLNEISISGYISSYSQADHRHGGDGAFYVFLK